MAGRRPTLLSRDGPTHGCMPHGQRTCTARRRRLRRPRASSVMLGRRKIVAGACVCVGWCVPSARCMAMCRRVAARGARTMRCLLRTRARRRASLTAAVAVAVRVARKRAVPSSLPTWSLCPPLSPQHSLLPPRWPRACQAMLQRVAGANAQTRCGMSRGVWRDSRRRWCTRPQRRCAAAMLRTGGQP